MANTESIKLVTGVPAVIRQMTPKEQRILTQESKVSDQERIAELLESILVSVGGIELAALSDKERKDLLANMMSPDKKKILIAARQASLGNDTAFTFNYEYTNAKGTTLKEEMEVNIDPEEFTEKPMCRFDPALLDGFTTLSAFKHKLKEAQTTSNEYAEYADLLQDSKVTFVLPISKTKVTFTCMNGKGELAASSYKKNQRNAHVTILARNLVRHTENGLISYTMSDLDKMSLIDLEVIRLIIKHVEPQIDTELIVPHPDADNLPKAEKNIIVDITGQISFFFPSGTI